jgi:hypothetical protein
MTQKDIRKNFNDFEIENFQNKNFASKVFD